MQRVKDTIKPEEAPVSSKLSRPAVDWKHVTLFLVTVGAVLLCWMIALPFLAAITGAITLAVVTGRPYRWLEGRVKRPAVAAALGVAAVMVSIITPAFFLVAELAKQALAVVNVLRTGEPQQRFAELLGRHPAIATLLENATRQINVEQVSQSAGSYIAGHVAALLGNTFGAFTQLVVMVFLLFFLYRDRRLAVVNLQAILPLEDADKELLIQRVHGTVYATSLGRVAVACVQGLLAGLAFWALGVDSPALWGMVTALVAVIPAVGAGLVWVPVAIYLAMTGHWVKAAILVAWGGLVVSTIDNFLYPVLVGSRLQQHTVMVLLSVIGGIALFGVPGVILGPVVLTVAKTLLEIWGRRAGPAVL